MVSRRDGRRRTKDLPVKDKAGDILKRDERADHGPVHAPPLEVRLGDGAVCEGLPCGIAREKEREPGTVDRDM